MGEAADEEALERRNRAGLGAAVVVAVLCLVAIVALRRIQAFVNSVGRQRPDEP
jgi:hypothetical protein